VGEVVTKRLDMQIDRNLRAIVLFYRECVEMLRTAGAEHRNALVVNTASIAGKSGQAWLSVYSATKADDRLRARARGNREHDPAERSLPSPHLAQLRGAGDRVPAAGRADLRRKLACVASFERPVL
jgi:hypothetical protein